jgi:peptidoglycan L-alanyl-D-glutamate endopeptidase CwlK
MIIEPIVIKRLGELHPLLREDAMNAYVEAVKKTPVGVHPFITQTLRTFEEQQVYYNQGRTTPGDIITHAKPGQSYHQYGLALDFVNLIGGKMYWPKRPQLDKNWMTVVEIFEAHGFEAGIRWKEKKNDPPHFEKRFGIYWKDLLALHNAGKVDENGYVIIK